MAKTKSKTVADVSNVIAVHKIQASGLFTANNNQYRNAVRPYYLQDFSRNTNDLVSDVDRKQLMSAARGIYANVSVMNAAINERAVYSVGDGFQFSYEGTNDKEATQAIDYLNSLSRYCVKNGNVTFTEYLQCACKWIDIDGDILGVNTVSADGKSPMIYAVHSNQVMSRNNQKVATGTYSGFDMYDGVVLSKEGYPVAWQVCPTDKPENDYYVDKNNGMLLFNQFRLDSKRGVSSFAPVIDDITRYGELWGYLIRMARMDATNAWAHVTDKPISQLAQKASGGTQVKTSTDALQQTYYRFFDQPEVLILRPNSGEDLKALETNRPSNNVMSFLRTTLAQALTGLGWALELSDIKELNGPSSRFILAKTDRMIADRQKLLRKLWEKHVSYFLLFAFEKKQIPYFDDWFKITPSYTRRMSIDFGRDERTEIERAKAGVTNNDILCGYDGYNSSTILRGKAKLMALAKQLEIENGLTPGSLIQITPNLQPAQATNEPIQQDPNV
jgi:hypothetical protein